MLRGGASSYALNEKSAIPLWNRAICSGKNPLILGDRIVILFSPSRQQIHSYLLKRRTVSARRRAIDMPNVDDLRLPYVSRASIFG